MGKATEDTKLFNEGETATAESTDTGSNGASGWESPATTDTDPSNVCVSAEGSFKRHRYGDSDVCTRCGTPKAVAASTREPGVPRTRGAIRTGDLETLISMAWMGMGIGIRKQPWIGHGATDDDPDIAGAVGRTVQMESALAGKRIDKALRRTPVYKHIVGFMGTAGVAADLAPLFLPPLLVGFAVARPDIAEEFKPMFVAMLVPVFAEQAKLMEQQMELMSKLDDVNEQTIQAASEFVDNLISGSRKPKNDKAV